MEFLTFLSNDFVLVGGHATRLYMPERHTEDVDIAIRESDAEEVHESILCNGGTYLLDLSIEGKSYEIDGQQLDVLYLSDKEFKEIHLHSVKGFGIKVISLPYLVLMKIQSGRVKDISDCSTLIGHADKSSVNKILRLVQRKSPNDVEDIESLISLAEYNIAL